MACASNDTALEKELKAQDDGLNTALKAKLISKALMYYDTKNYVSLSKDEGKEILRLGVEGCKKELEGMIKDGFDSSWLNFTPLKCWKDGNYAFSVANWEFPGYLTFGKKTGSVVSVSKKVAGQWKNMITVTSENK